MALRMNTPPRQRIRRFGSKVALSLATLLVVVVALGAAGGGAYMWYMGRHGAEESTVYKKADAGISPKQTAASLGTSLTVESVTSPVMPGATATLIAKTDPNAKCLIEVTYDQVKAVDNGLLQKTADKEGSVSWTWKVAPAAAEGKWPAKVTCTNKKSSTIAQGELVVSKSSQASSSSTSKN